MSKETFWLIIASIAPLVAVALIYIGMENSTSGLAWLGVAIFALGMLITPILRFFPPAED